MIFQKASVRSLRLHSSPNESSLRASLEVFLSQIEKELSELVKSLLNYSNFSKEEWQAMRSLVNDRSAVIKKADKGSCKVVCDREDHIAEAEKTTRCCHRL